MVDAKGSSEPPLVEDELAFVNKSGLTWQLLVPMVEPGGDDGRPAWKNHERTDTERRHKLRSTDGTLSRHLRPPGHRAA
jgi:hypothetical protein